MSNFQEDVRAFHLKFEHPAPPRPVRDLHSMSEVLEFRIDRIEEETRELVEAIRERNLAKIAAEGIDLIYVVVGLFVILGLPLLPFWRDVQRANMAKVQNPTGGKPLKPEGWVGPNPAQVLYDIKRTDDEDEAK